MKIGKAIRELRLKKGFKTQKDLAHVCNTTINTISQIELGKVFPKKETLKRICQAIDIPESYIIMYSVTEEDVSKEKRKVFRALNEAMKALLVSSNE